MRSRFLALLLVLAILPVTGEAIEFVVHWAEHGDVAHATSDDHESAPLGSDEHGCSGLFHMCACHNVQATAPHQLVVTASVSTDTRVDASSPPQQDGRGAPAPSIRPPIA